MMKTRSMLMIAVLLALTLSAQFAMGQAYEQIQWNSPKPINERISGETYVLPDGWQAATEGVEKIKVSNFGALKHDPATVANAERFQELTGIEVEVLPWAEPPIVAKTISIFAAKSDAVDVLCYDHPTTYMQMVAGGWLHPIDAIWDDPEVWKLYAAPLQEGLKAPDGHIYGSIGQTKTMMLFYRPSVVPEPPETWQELRAIAKEVTTPEMWGYVFSAGGEMDIVYPLRDMVYSQGGRIVDKERQRLVIDSPEAKNAWQMLADMVLVDKSAPTSVLEYSWMGASDMFAVGKTAMVMTHTVDANRYQDPKSAPGIQGDWAVAAPPKWDESMPDSYHASYFDVDGYMINTFINDKQKAASMLYLDFMRSYEASFRELIMEGNEAAVLSVYDSKAAQEVPVPQARKAAMSNAVLETFPPAGRSLTDIIKEFFAYVVNGQQEPMEALEECQALLNDYAVPE
ncbi:extracellular solute-binding protein [candidate division KSB3 bacterium]|uniref:Extracellular solute-binding protein n=1 Tax=candidate division KSB3 bacterium TaxID=2044937 RepID=A0A9D5JRQ8_9BACT|nr:extracellular solute-binding protein [candidate division KSB3 bacterium]MBD3323043.1 extracellular solute-binding protein [candidate division KSB3 bacterium]